MNGSTMKVDFLIIGAARSGTTSLSQIVASHPDIGFCSVKEPQFFCKEDWRDHLEDYHSLFKSEGKIFGEGSTNYSKFPAFNASIHSDIFEYNPNMKLIYILRHPIDRIVSHYKFSLERGYSDTDINTEVLNKPIYTNSSRYFFQVEPYLKLFGKENLKLVLLDDFKNQPEKVMNSVFEFLDVSPFDFSPKLLHTNKSQSGSIRHKKYDHPVTLIDKLKKGIHIIFRKLAPKKSSELAMLTEATRAQLILILKDDVKQMEVLLKRDLSHWLK